LRRRLVRTVPQDPLTALNPVMRIWRQMREGAAPAQDPADWLGQVGLTDVKRVLGSWPHQLSGGQRQRVLIAMAMMSGAPLLIADEPTTALDVTVQAQILDLLQDLQRDFGSAVIIITHDLGVVAEMADDVLVMYGGRAVEHGTCKQILSQPMMPYTWGLLESVPELDSDPTQRLLPIAGTPPSLLSPPSGCPFHPRCRFREHVPGDLCVTQLPDLEPPLDSPDRLKRCHIKDTAAVLNTDLVPSEA